VGEGTNARAEGVAEVLAARATLDEELVRLEASFRAAIDIPAKVRRHPVKTAGLAAGAGFVVVGGPKRVLRRAKRAVFGREAALPKSMLPREIEGSLKALGTDGERVQGLIEREFATYLRAHGPERQRKELSRTLTIMMVTALRPLVIGASKKVAGQVFSTDAESFSERLAQARARVEGSVASKTAGTPKPGDTAD